MTDAVPLLNHLSFLMTTLPEKHLLKEQTLVPPVCWPMLEPQEFTREPGEVAVNNSNPFVNTCFVSDAMLRALRESWQLIFGINVVIPIFPIGKLWH